MRIHIQNDPKDPLAVTSNNGRNAVAAPAQSPPATR